MEPIGAQELFFMAAAFAMVALVLAGLVATALVHWWKRRRTQR